MLSYWNLISTDFSMWAINTCQLHWTQLTLSSVVLVGSSFVLHSTCTENRHFKQLKIHAADIKCGAIVCRFKLELENMAIIMKWSSSGLNLNLPQHPLQGNCLQPPGVQDTWKQSDKVMTTGNPSYIVKKFIKAIWKWLQTYFRVLTLTWPPGTGLSISRSLRLWSGWEHWFNVMSTDIVFLVRHFSSGIMLTCCMTWQRVADWIGSCHSQCGDDTCQ